MTQDQFERLIKPERKRLRTFCGNLNPNRDDAEDLFSQTLIRAWQSIETFNADNPVGGWLFRIASNMHKDNLRHKGRRPKCCSLDAAIEGQGDSGTPDIRFDPPDPAPVALDLLVGIEMHQEFLSKLGDFDRNTLELRLAGVRYSDIAKVHGIPLGTVRSRLHRAFKMVRRGERKAAKTRRAA